MQCIWIHSFSEAKYKFNVYENKIIEMLVEKKFAE